MQLLSCEQPIKTFVTQTVWHSSQSELAYESLQGMIGPSAELQLHLFSIYTHDWLKFERVRIVPILFETATKIFQNRI